MPGNAVVPGQALVRRRCSARPAGRARCGPRARWSRTAARSRGASPSAGCRRSRGRRGCPARRAARFAGAATVRRSCRPAPTPGRRRSILSTCASSTPGSRSRLVLGQRQQLVVRRAAPEEERQARCQLQVAHPVRRPRPGARRVALDAEDEVGAHQEPLEPEAHAGLEAPVAAPGLEEVEQRLDLGPGDRAAIRAPGQPLEDAPRAGRLVRPARGTAGEDARAGNGVSPPAAPCGPVIVTVSTWGRPLGRLPEDGEAAQVREPRSLDLRRRPIEEADADHVLPRLERYAHAEPGVGLAVPVGAPPARLGVVGLGLRRVAAPPDREELDPLAVDRDLDLVRLREPHDAAADEVPLQAHLDVVLPADREVALDPGAAARAERQSVEAPVLRQVRRHPVHDLLDGRARISDRAGRDGARRVEVAVQQRGRHAQHVADVVEPVARVVRRQQSRGVDLEPQEVADRVGVLRAIQAVERGPPAGVGLRGRCRIELRFEVGDQAVVGCLVGPGPRRGRHRPRAQLARHLLPRSRVAADRRDVGRVEREVGDAQPLVVAGDAVAVERRPVLGGLGPRRRRRGGSGERRRGAGCQQQRRTRGRDRKRARRRLLLHLLLPALGPLPHPRRTLGAHRRGVANVRLSLTRRSLPRRKDGRCRAAGVPGPR